MPFDRMIFPHLCPCASIHLIWDTFDLVICCGGVSSAQRKTGKHVYLFLLLLSTNLLQRDTCREERSKLSRDRDLNLSFRLFSPSRSCTALPWPPTSNYDLLRRDCLENKEVEINQANESFFSRSSRPVSSSASRSQSILQTPQFATGCDSATSLVLDFSLTPKG